MQLIYSTINIDFQHSFPSILM